MMDVPSRFMADESNANNTGLGGLNNTSPDGFTGGLNFTNYPLRSGSRYFKKFFMLQFPYTFPAVLLGLIT